MESPEKMAEGWLSPLKRERRKLKNVLREMEPFKLLQEDVPLRIKLIENPEWFTSKFFSGAVDLFTHDCIHALLGRGLLPKDEAFVIGYTMGSTKKISRLKRNLFMFCSKYLYPKGYRLGEEERFVFNLGIMAGSHCGADLSLVNFKEVLNLSLSKIRLEFKIDKRTLECCYRLEKQMFPNSRESQRLL